MRFGRVRGEIDGGYGVEFCFAYIETAIEECTVFNSHAGSGGVAGDGGLGTDLYAVKSGEVAVDLAHDNDIAGNDAGGYAAALPDGYATVRKIDAALHAALDEQ